MTNDKKMSVPSAEDIHIASESGEEAVAGLIGNPPSSDGLRKLNFGTDTGKDSKFSSWEFC